MPMNNQSVFDKYKNYLGEGSDTIITKSVSGETFKSIHLLDEKEVLSILKNFDWSFLEDNTTYLSHDIHPYPAKFVPQLPRRMIKLFSESGEMVWDPFGGSGTTALESLINDRNCISTDVNPIGNIIGKAKTTALCSSDESELNKLVARFEYYLNNTICLSEYFEENKKALENEIPSIPNIEKWFAPTIICELAFIKHLIKTELNSEAAINIAKASFSKIITRVSNQENETTYRAVGRTTYIGEAIELFLKDLKSNFEKVKSLSSMLGYRKARFITTNVMQPIVGEGSFIQKDEVDLIVTSPPYPNAFDYHLYHRFRIFWLDADPREMGKVEIGSHLKYQRGKKTFEQFEDEMTPVLENCFMALKSGRYAIFVLGDALFDGVEYKTAERVGKLAERIGFINVGIIDRELPANKRSVKSWARRATSEQILILKKPVYESSISLIPVKYKLWPYEKLISDMERNVLCGQLSDDFSVNTQIDINKYKMLTFYDGFRVNGTEFKTWQSILEHGVVDNVKRKEPKYLTHGIHPYKGKFYPQLVRPLLNILEIKNGSVVFDPFCGSGTVALEAILNGCHAYGCDINPIAVEIATAKNNIIKVTPYEFEKHVMFFRKELDGYIEANYHDVFDIEAIEEIQSWFPEKVISKLGFILSKIKQVPDERIRCFLKVVLSSIIREISQQDPSDLRIRRRKEPLDDAPVIELYVSNLEKQYKNIIDFHKISNNAPNPIGDACIWRGNATDIDQVLKNVAENSVDIVITSPPYATALPYIDTNRLNMLILDGLNAEKRVPIEAEMTGTREIKKTTRDYYEKRIVLDDYASIVSETAKNVIYKIFSENVNSNVGFRKRNMAALIYMYFNDMTEVMKTLNTVVKSNGYICMVIGDTTTTTGVEKVAIKTTQMLRETGEYLGWSLISDIPVSVTVEKYKHMNNSITENNILIFKK